MPKIDPNHYSVVGTSGKRKALYWTLGLVVVAALVAGFVVFQNWRSSPDFFATDSFTVDVDRQAGQSTSIVLAAPGSDRSDTITLDSLVPRLDHNTAQAKITTGICREGTAEGALESLQQVCSDVVAVEDAEYSGGDSGDQLVVTITPARQGRVIIEGFDVTYSDGAKHGTQTIDVDVEVLVYCELPEGEERPPLGTPRSCA